MKYKDLLDLAHSIYKDHDTEAAYRTAMSRAYYSTFYPARDLRDRHQLSATGAEHEALARALKSRKEFLQIGNAMDMLRKERLKADYHLATRITASCAKAALSKAKRLHDEIEKHQTS